MLGKVFLNAGNFVKIGDRIKRARLAAGWTQVQLAKAVGIDKSAVAQWETPNNRKGITTDNLVKVANALAIPVSSLIGDDPHTERLDLTSDEATLVRLFRRMSIQQQRVHLQLFYLSAGLAQPEEPQCNPTDGKRIAG